MVEEPPSLEPTDGTGEQFRAGDRVQIVLGVLSGLQQLEWQVPREMSVCGFGDIPMARVIIPALTTVHIDLRELGRAGAHKLLAQLRREPVSFIEVLPTTVVERDTTAPPLGPLENDTVPSETMSTTTS